MKFAGEFFGNTLDGPTHDGAGGVPRHFERIGDDAKQQAQGEKSPVTNEAQWNRRLLFQRPSMRPRAGRTIGDGLPEPLTPFSLPRLTFRMVWPEADSPVNPLEGSAYCAKW